MELDLDDLFAASSLPLGYAFVPWHEDVLEDHAEVKYLSFRFEIDANVFPCLGERAGCKRLMQEISRRDGFCPEATWLVVQELGGKTVPCGTVQGICDRAGFGSIQNLGIAPAHRGLGIGRTLLRKALVGFQSVGMPKATLEVTAQNRDALRLYERLGFKTERTVYKAAEIAYA